MKPTEITNYSLPKPQMLLMAYEAWFDYYNELQEKIDSRAVGPQDYIDRLEIIAFKDKQKSVSETLRNIDEMIHRYIKSHQIEKSKAA